MPRIYLSTKIILSTIGKQRTFEICMFRSSLSRAGVIFQSKHMMSTLAMKPLVSLVSVKAENKTQASFSSTAELDPHGGFERLSPSNPADKLEIFITDRNGKEHTIDCKVGDNLLFLCRVLQENTPELYLEGACEASLACSTCHVVIDTENHFDILPEASEEEEDMLDQASCLTPTSRLACQVKLTKDLNGMKVTLPKFSRNFYVDGHIPQPH